MKVGNSRDGKQIALEVIGFSTTYPFSIDTVIDVK
jgi:hypothetical protein